MDKKVTIERIANELKLSKATVSKAINNCPGVNSNTKRAVMQAACGYGYLPSRPKQTLAAVLPSIPSYFWGDMRKRISAYAKEEKIDCKCYVYPNLYDTTDALRCTEQAVKDGASAVILAAPDTDEIKRLLESVASSVLIILIEEFLDIKNAFYIGADSFEQGYSLGKEYMESYPEAISFAVLHSTEFYTERERVKGFMQAVREYGREPVLDIHSDTDSKTQSAGIARALAVAKSAPDCIFCPSGNLSMAALAVKKLKADKQIHCIGFDINTESGTEGYENILSHILLQDTDIQAKKAVECAIEFLRYGNFPNQKMMWTKPAK